MEFKIIYKVITHVNYSKFYSFNKRSKKMKKFARHEKLAQCIMILSKDGRPTYNNRASYSPQKLKFRASTLRLPCRHSGIDLYKASVLLRIPPLCHGSYIQRERERERDGILVTLTLPNTCTLYL